MFCFERVSSGSPGLHLRYFSSESFVYHVTSMRDFHGPEEYDIGSLVAIA